MLMDVKVQGRQLSGSYTLRVAIRSEYEYVVVSLYQRCTVARDTYLCASGCDVEYCVSAVEDGASGTRNINKHRPSLGMGSILESRTRHMHIRDIPRTPERNIC
jgi:hypothetical protein